MFPPAADTVPEAVLPKLRPDVVPRLRGIGAPFFGEQSCYSKPKAAPPTNSSTSLLPFRPQRRSWRVVDFQTPFSAIRKGLCEVRARRAWADNLEVYVHARIDLPQRPGVESARFGQES